MRALRRAAAFVRRHKHGEETLAEAVGINIATRIVGAALAAGAASAAITAGFIDLSNNNGSHAAVAIAAPGVRVVEAKATEGVFFKDGLYGTFRTAAAKHHRVFGGYLFLRPNESGAAQARYFLAYARPKPGDLQPVVDSETGSPAAAARATYGALHELELHGYRPLLYASSSYLARLVAADPAIKRFRVWQAEYGPVLHLVPGVHVIAWQFTDRARVADVAIDGSHLLVRSVKQLEWKPAPAKKVKPKRLKPPCGIERPRPVAKTGCRFVR